LSGFFRFWFPPILYAVLIFFLSSLSKPPIPFEIESNILHYPEYAVLSFLLLRAFHYGKKENVSIKNALFSFFISIFFGLTDEFHQAFVPARVPEVNDLLRDSAGTLAGIVIFILFNYIYNKLKGQRQCQIN
jgi:VanZ family protein